MPGVAPKRAFFGSWFFFVLPIVFLSSLGLLVLISAGSGRSAERFKVACSRGAAEGFKIARASRASVKTQNLNAGDKALSAAKARCPTRGCNKI